MKKNIGNILALYPTPLVVVGTMVNGKTQLGACGTCRGSSAMTG